MEFPSIDEDSNIIRVLDKDQNVHTFNLANVKNMTVGEVTSFLSVQAAFGSTPGNLLFVWYCKDGKHDVSIAEKPKKMKELNKKWGKQKPEKFYRFVFMRPSDSFIPTANLVAKAKAMKHKSGGKDKKEKLKDNRKTSPANFITPVNVPPPLGAADGLPRSNSGEIPPPPPPLGGGDGIPLPPPPPPMGGGIPAGGIPPPPPSTGPVPPTVSKAAKAQHRKSWFGGNKKDSGAASAATPTSSPKPNRASPAKVSGGLDLAGHDDWNADTIIKNINAFVDPSGDYAYETEPARPDFGISAKELKEGWMNLNTSNANKIAKNPQFQKVIITWMNKHLAKRNLQVTNLQTDLQNGVLLIRLMEAVSGQEVKKFYPEPKKIPEFLENLEIVFKFAAVLGMPIKAEPHDVYHGKLSTICGLLFMLIQKFKDGKKAGFFGPKKVDIKVAKIDEQKARVMLDGELTLQQKYATGTVPMAPVPLVNPEAIPPPPPEDDDPALPSLPPPGVPSLPPPGLPSLPPPIPTGPPAGLPTPIGLPAPIPATGPALPKLPPPITTGRLAPSNAPPKLPSSALPKPLPKLAAVAAIDENEELSLDDLDASLLLQDMVDLDSFVIPEEDAVDIDNNEDMFGDLDSMQELLAGVAGDLGDFDFNLDDFKL